MTKELTKEIGYIVKAYYTPSWAYYRTNWGGFHRIEIGDNSVVIDLYDNKYRTDKIISIHFLNEDCDRVNTIDNASKYQIVLESGWFLVGDL